MATIVEAVAQTTVAPSLSLAAGLRRLALDVEYLEMRKTQLQATADEAALSVAAEYQHGNSSWASVAAIETKSSAAANGYSKPTVVVQQFDSLSFQLFGEHDHDQRLGRLEIKQPHLLCARGSCF